MTEVGQVPHRLVLVEWEDSAQPVSEWQWVADYPPPEFVKCVSVGYLIAETDQAIAVAQNIGDVGCERIQASGIIRIPRSAVQRITDLYGGPAESRAESFARLEIAKRRAPTRGESK